MARPISRRGIPAGRPRRAGRAGHDARQPVPVDAGMPAAERPADGVEGPQGVLQVAGSCASGQVESLTHTVRVRRLTWIICPWIPRQSSTSPCSPGRNQNWLRYQPPGNDGLVGDAANTERMSASTAQAPRSHLGGMTGADVVAGGHRAAVEQQLPEPRQVPGGRAQPAVVARDVPMPSQMISASRSAPIGCQTKVGDQVGHRPAGRRVRRPSPARRSPRSGRGTARRAAPRLPASRRKRVEPSPPGQPLVRSARRRPRGRCSPRRTAPRCACRARGARWRRRSRCRRARARSR